MLRAHMITRHGDTLLISFADRLVRSVKTYTRQNVREPVAFPWARKTRVRTATRGNPGGDRFVYTARPASHRTHLARWVTDARF